MHKVFIKRKPSRNSAEDFSCTVMVGNNNFPLQLNPNDCSLLAFLLKEDEEFKKKGEIEKPLFISKSDFEDKDSGEKIEFISYVFNIGESQFKLRPRPEDKRLLSYLLKDELN